MDPDNLDLPGLDLGPAPGEQVTIGAAAPADPPRRDAFEAVHELGTTLGARIDQLAGIVERVATSNARPAEPAKPAEPAGMGPSELQAAIASGQFKNKADLAKFLNDRALSSPNGIGEVFVEMLGMADAIASDKVRAGTVPFSEGRALDQLDRFRRDNLSDKYFLVAREEFDQIVDQEKARGAFKNMTAEQVQQGLQAIKEMAIGRVVTKKSAPLIPDNVRAIDRSAQIPRYAVGSGGGASGSMGGAGGGTRVDMTPRTETERLLIESATSYGFSREEIAESLQAHRNDPSQGLGA